MPVALEKVESGDLCISRFNLSEAVGRFSRIHGIPYGNAELVRMPVHNYVEW